jgi:hypothetical protein
MLRLDFKASLNYEEVFNVLENLHLLQEIAFTSLLIDKVIVIFTQNRVVCPFKV